MGAYDPSYLNRSIAIARHYSLWIIVDYHGYDDIASSSGVTCWLSFWRSVVQQFHNSYDRIVWEPINEPILPNNTDISSFSSDYQQWIDQARSIGDTHWIVVQNMCSSSCGFSNMADGYPTVTDSAGKVFISLHSYMGYFYYSSTWNNSTADSLAQQFYNAVVSGSQRTGWPVLNTEGGPDPQGINCSGGVSLPSPLCTPDQVLVGSAGYSIVTFHFIQTLTRLYDANTPQRINWLWWPMGSWTDTPGAGLYGALAIDGWGSLLQYQNVAKLPIPLPSFSWSPANGIVGQSIIFTASVTGGNPPYSFAWDFGDSGKGLGALATHSYLQAGNYTITLAVTDSSASTGQAKSLISIGNGSTRNTSPVLAVPGLQTVMATQSLSFDVTASDIDLDPIIILAASGLPSAATFTVVNGNPASGIFTWTPSQSQAPGDYTITFSADDSHGATVSSSVQVHVDTYVAPVVLSLPGPQTVVVGQTLSFTATVTNPNAVQGSITLSASGLVAGMSFSPATGVFSFTPDTTQVNETFNITFTATSTANPTLFDTKVETIHVDPANVGPSGGNGGSGGGCAICGLIPNLSPTLLLLGIGGMLGLGFFIAALPLRAKVRRHQSRL
jgi:hypothetical protein